MQHNMLIAEDLMLLLLDDESGSIARAGSTYYPLGAAILAELALHERVKADETSPGSNEAAVLVFDGNTLADPLLRKAFENVARRTGGIETLLPHIGAQVYQPVIDRLCRRGLLQPTRKRARRLLHEKPQPDDDGQYEADLMERIRRALEDGITPDYRTSAVIALLSASGSLYSLHPAIAWSGTVIERAQSLEKRNWAASALSTVTTRAADVSSIDKKPTSGARVECSIYVRPPEPLEVPD